MGAKRLYRGQPSAKSPVQLGSNHWPTEPSRETPQRDQRPLRSPRQLLPSILAFLATTKQLFIPAETPPSAFQSSIKATNSRKPSPGSPEPGTPWAMERPPPQAPGTRVKYNQGNPKSSMYGKISASGGQGSPDQVEGQPIYDEGLEGCSSQGQVELETLPGSWAPHVVRSQGCCSQRAHNEVHERR